VTAAVDVASEVAAVDAALAARGTRKRADGAKAYLKSDLDFYGVDAKGIRATVREVYGRHPGLDRDGLISLVRALWTVPVFEMRAVAVGLCEYAPDLLGPEDLELIEELLRQSRTWALVDWLCTKVVAPIVKDHPRCTEVLKGWAADGDFWIRRSAMLSLLIELRAGGGDFELFARFASSMIDEKEFFIRKAIGWVLREVAKKRPELTYGFLSEHIDRVSGLTLREGAKYLPEEQRDDLTRRYRERQPRSLGQRSEMLFEPEPEPEPEPEHVQRRRTIARRNRKIPSPEPEQ
jgi:3-methyladenine DNA glycosylase AlkD